MLTHGGWTFAVILGLGLARVLRVDMILSIQKTISIPLKRITLLTWIDKTTKIITNKDKQKKKQDSDTTKVELYINVQRSYT